MKPTDLSAISDYLDNIKKWAYNDIVHIQNNVLNKNPYTSNFISKCILDKKERNVSYIFIFKNILIYYFRTILIFINYCISFTIFKLLNKGPKFKPDKSVYLIDIFFLVDTIISKGEFNDEYFVGLYSVLEKYDKNIVFIPRLYGLNRQPFKIYQLLQVIKRNKKYGFLFEYDLLEVLDLIKIFIFIIKYPFKQFGLLQPRKSKMDMHFNYELFDSLKSTSFEAYTRYLVGKKVANILPPSSNIISWQEFQNLEKTFYKAIRESGNDIFIFGCELLVKYKTYLSMHITNIDVDKKITPNLTLINGKYNYSKSNEHFFKTGVSLRYKKMFSYLHSNQKSNKDKHLALLSYDVKESVNMLKQIVHINEIKIKTHPATSKDQFTPYINSTWGFCKGNIYDEFKTTSLVFVAPMSGSALEAVSCGISVVIIASKGSIVANPLIDYGKGKIWDIVYSRNDVEIVVRNLIYFRKYHMEEIESIGSWYKENFFINPTTKNIAKVFNLIKGQ